MADVRTLPDAETIAEATSSPTHVTIRREDYRPPDWLVPEIALRFTLDIEKTRVQAKLNVERNTAASQDAAPLRLNGDELTPVGVWVDGVRHAAGAKFRWIVGQTLVLGAAADAGPSLALAGSGQAE